MNFLITTVTYKLGEMGWNIDIFSKTKIIENSSKTKEEEVKELYSELSLNNPNETILTEETKVFSFEKIKLLN